VLSPMSQSFCFASPLRHISFILLYIALYFYLCYCPKLFLNCTLVYLVLLVLFIHVFSALKCLSVMLNECLWICWMKKKEVRDPRNTSSPEKNLKIPRWEVVWWGVRR
jgi:hypothetical protein